MKLVKKVVIVVIFALIVSSVSGVSFCWYTQSINGLQTRGMSKEQIKSELEKVEHTTISYKKSNIDLTSICSYSADEFEKKFGSQTIGVKKSIDRSSLEKLLKAVKLEPTKKIDIDGLIKGLNYGGNTDLSDYIVDRYSEDTTKEYERLVNWSISYTSGYKFSKLKDYIKINKNGKITIDNTFTSIILKNLEKDYNTVGKAIKFTDHRGKSYKIKNYNSTWGDKINTEKEQKFLIDAVKSSKGVKNREPEFEQKTGKLGNNYIEVSISDQMVWLVKNGKVVMSSPCVTGRRGVHDTPKGVFYILERRSGKWLTGAGYRTWVNKWLRVTWQGVGLHDASWRSTFGGNIYSYNGSHGCVNLPYSFVSRLYNKVTWGYPVVIH